MPASIVDPHSAGISSSDVPAESRAIRFAKSRFAEISGVFFMGEKNIIPWAGFVERLLDGCTRSGGVAPTGRAVAAATARPGDSILFSVWRAEIHVEGFFSLLLWTIGFLEHERQARPHAQLLVDWTDERITFSQADGRTDAHANAWNDFFYQPVAPTDGKDGKDGKEAAAAAEPLASEVHEAAQRDRLRVVNHCGRPRFFAKFADFRGAQPVPEGFKGKVVGGGQITGGRVDEGTAASGAGGVQALAAAEAADIRSRGRDREGSARGANGSKWRSPRGRRIFGHRSGGGRGGWVACRPHTTHRQAADVRPQPQPEREHSGPASRKLRAVAALWRRAPLL